MSVLPTYRFHVFLSHNSADKPLVEALAVRLMEQGIEPWLDKWHLVPGVKWQGKLSEALAQSETCVAIVGPGGFGSWQEEEVDAAIRRRVRERSGGFRIIPVLLPGVEKPELAKLPEFLTAATWVEFRQSINEDEPFRRLVCGIRGVEPGVAPGSAPFAGECPYRGLEVFDFNDRDPRFFCGREAQIDDLLERLRNTLETDPSGGALRFLAILGASGGGKSSLARAGLLPALREGRIAGSERWPIAIARPGDHPLEALAVAMNGLGGAAALNTYDRIVGKTDGPRSLHAASRLILGEPTRAGRVVVLIDQFEEAFTLCQHEEERRDLIDNLMEAAKSPRGPVVVVLAMRSDFLPRCAPYSALVQAISARQFPVEPMGRDALRRVIERPAQLAGLEPERGLADLLLDDAEKNPGSLPMLQFVLKELWSRRRGHQLEVDAYRAIGGMERAIANRADDVFARLEKHGRGDVARRVFLGLVKLGEGTEDTRRRARKTDLIPAGSDESTVEEVLAALTDRDARLVTASKDGTVEVAHEALIRTWPKLKTWVDSDRDGERTKQRLDESAAEWDRNGRSPGYLEHGPRLALARKWADDHPGILGVLAVDFLAASLALERSEEQAREDDLRQRLELAEAREQAEREKTDQALQFAEQQARTTRRLRKLTALVASLLVAALGVAAVAYYQRNQARIAKERAQEQTRVATSHQLAALSVSDRVHNLDRSLLLAVESIRMKDTIEARTSLVEAILIRSTLRSFLDTSNKPVEAVAFSPDGKTIAAACVNGSVVLFDAATRSPLAGPPIAVGDVMVTAIAFGPDGKTIAAAHNRFGEGDGVTLLDVATRSPLGPGMPIAIAEGGVMAVAFSPDGKTIAAGYAALVLGGGRGIALCDAATRSPLAGPPIAVAGGRAPVGVEEAPRSLPARPPVSVAGAVAFSPDGKTIAAAYNGFGNSGDVALFDAATRSPLAPGKPLAVDGGAAAAARLDRGGQPGEPGRFTVAEGDVTAIAFSRDVQTIAAGYGGGVALFGTASLSRLSEPSYTVTEGRVTSVALSPDGKTIAAGYDGVTGGGVALFDTEARPRLGGAPIAVATGDLQDIAFGPDGRRIIGSDMELLPEGQTPVEKHNVGGGGVTLLDVDLVSWQRHAGSMANRNFRRDEWHRYFQDEPGRSSRYRRTFRNLPFPDDLPDSEKQEAMDWEAKAPPRPKELAYP